MHFACSPLMYCVLYRELSLSTTWPSLSEEMIVDTDVYTLVCRIIVCVNCVSVHCVVAYTDVYTLVCRIIARVNCVRVHCVVVT